jgi:hypothetical protein
VEVQLTATAQFAHEQQQTQPQQKAFAVDEALGSAAVRDVVEPGVEVGEEVPDGADEEGSDG